MWNSFYLRFICFEDWSDQVEFVLDTIGRVQCLFEKELLDVLRGAGFLSTDAWDRGADGHCRWCFRKYGCKKSVWIDPFFSTGWFWFSAAWLLPKKHLEYLLPEGDEAHLSKHSPFGNDFLRCWTLIMSLYVSPQNLGFPGSCGLLAPRYGSQLKEGVCQVSQMWNEKRTPGCLGYIEGELLPFVMGLIISCCRNPY